MKTQALTFERAAAMPASTYHFLDMNDTTLEIPEGLVVSPDVKASGARGAADAFEAALAGAQTAWEAEHPAPTAEEQAALAEFMAAEADATYGGTARSNYQIAADAIEESRSLSIAFENGMGEETTAYLRHVAGEPVVVRADADEAVNAQVVVSGVAGSLSAAAIDVIADKGSEVSLSIVVDGQNESDEFAGLTGTTLRVFAGEGSQVSIVRTQTLDEGFADIDDMGLFAAADARIDVRQTVLGASTAFTGLAGDLRGDQSRIEVDTRYLGHGDQKRDFNYSLRHHGVKTKSDMKANGVLAGRSRKTLRGTIDLVRGCKGAEGSENETVLLVDDAVRNKTVPVILCNEDDVAGNHGATIGHIRDEQLFYLASRGLSQEAAEKMFAAAMVEQAAIDAPDEASRAGVVRFGERLTPGFAALFDEVE